MRESRTPTLRFPAPALLASESLLRSHFADAGICNDNIHTSTWQDFQSLAEHGQLGRMRRDIHLDRLKHLALGLGMLAPKLIRNRLGTLEVQVSDQDVGSSLGPEAHHLPSKTGCGSGDDNVETIELRDKLTQRLVQVEWLIE